MSESETTDDLLRAVAGADRAAFRRLYNQAGRKLFGIALRICGDRTLAEDALQEALADIWRTAERFDPTKGGADAWMGVITRNRAIDAVRRRGRTGVEVGSEDDVYRAEADPRADTDGGVAFMALVACLERLEERERDAVLKAYYLGESRADLAKQYEAPENTVKTWLRRSLMKLRTCLDE